MLTKETIRVEGDMILPEDWIYIGTEKWEVVSTKSPEYGVQDLNLRRHQKTAKLRVYAGHHYRIVSRG